MVVWKYEDAGGQVARGVRWAVAVQNLEALRILLGVSYWKAGVLVLAGRAAEGLVEGVLLSLGRLGGVGGTFGLGWEGWRRGLGL
jgi:lipid intermediate transporter